MIRPPLRAPEPVMADWLLAHIRHLPLGEWRQLAREIGLLRRAA